MRLWVKPAVIDEIADLPGNVRHMYNYAPKWAKAGAEAQGSSSWASAPKGEHPRDHASGACSRTVRTSRASVPAVNGFWSTTPCASSSSGSVACAA